MKKCLLVFSVVCLLNVCVYAQEKQDSILIAEDIISYQILDLNQTNIINLASIQSDELWVLEHFSSVTRTTNTEAGFFK